MEQTTIQSFYSRETAPDRDTASSPTKSVSTDDGFTTEELDALLHPEALPPWQPKQEYHYSSIAELRAGMGRVQIVGRIANFTNKPGSTPQNPRSQGQFKLLVKDDTGVVTVRLWYSRLNYNLRLGQLVSVWTPFVAAKDPSPQLLSSGYQFITVFPEVDRSCFFEVVDEARSGGLCRLPLGRRDDESLPHLMTLQALLDGGNEVDGARVLLCVRSIGPRQRCTVKRNTPAAREAERVELAVCDDTHSATLTLWDAHCPSARSWTPCGTVLLLTSATVRSDRADALGLGPRALVDVDPLLRDAVWLRDHVRAAAKRARVNPPVPVAAFAGCLSGGLDATATAMGTLAELDDAVRAAPGAPHVRRVSVVLTELAIAKMHQRGQLCADECCNLSVYANAPAAVCRHCEAPLELRPNPRMLFTLADATGSINGSRLVVAEAAWAQLLGCPRGAADLCARDPAALRDLETCLLYLRVTVLLGWSPDVGRLAVLAVAA